MLEKFFSRLVSVVSSLLFFVCVAGIIFIWLFIPQIIILFILHILLGTPINVGYTVYDVSVLSQILLFRLLVDINETKFDKLKEIFDTEPGVNYIGKFFMDLFILVLYFIIFEIIAVLIYLGLFLFCKWFNLSWNIVYLFLASQITAFLLIGIVDAIRNNRD